MPKNAKVCRLFRPLDMAVAAAVLTLALLLLLFPFLVHEKEGALTLEIRVEDRRYLLPLDQDCQRELSSGKYTLTVCISQGAAFVAESNCPDGRCLHSGKISRQGQSILCAPAAISLQVISQSGEVDGNAG